MPQPRKCFACDRPITTISPRLVDTRDDQVVEVGQECFRKIIKAGDVGYQSPRGGPRLWLLERNHAIRPFVTRDTAHTLLFTCPQCGTEAHGKCNYCRECGQAFSY